jgi:hypothetical protein
MKLARVHVRKEGKKQKAKAQRKAKIAQSLAKKK